METLPFLKLIQVRYNKVYVGGILSNFTRAFDKVFYIVRFSFSRWFSRYRPFCPILLRKKVMLLQSPTGLRKVRRQSFPKNLRRAIPGRDLNWIVPFTRAQIIKYPKFQKAQFEVIYEGASFDISLHYFLSASAPVRNVSKGGSR